jgi:hypothetical protein
MSCRVALLRLERQGLVQLPAPRTRPPKVGKILRTPQGDPQAEIELESGRVELTLEPVGPATSPLWNELIDRYHYLGYRRAGGAQMRFLVRASGKLIALLGYSAAAWRVAPRETFIGWTEDQRQQRLHRVVDSRILGLASRKLGDYWETRYRYRPVLLETFVEARRFAGTCYQAANWICVGRTKGRGKWDRTNAHDQPVKTIWLYPLHPRFREVLCG